MARPAERCTRVELTGEQRLRCITTALHQAYNQPLPEHHVGPYTLPQ